MCICIYEKHIENMIFKIFEKKIEKMRKNKREKK